MQLQDSITKLASDFDYRLEFDITDAEQSMADARDRMDRQGRYVDDASWQRILDLYGLAGVEAALFSVLADRRAPVLTTERRLAVGPGAYYTGVEKFICTPDGVPNCLDQMLGAPSMADVIPLRGDYLKLYPGGGRPEFSADVERYVQHANQLTSIYRALFPIGDYFSVPESGLLHLECGVWLARATTMDLATGDRLDETRRRLDRYSAAFRGDAAAGQQVFT